MENQDKLIQELINHLTENGRIYSRSYRERKNISQYEWDELIKVARESDLIAEMANTEDGTFNIRPKGEIFKGEAYLSFKRKEWQEREKERLKKEDRESKESEKLNNEVLLSKWQKKTFWWVFALGGIGGLCGIISLGLQLTTKPLIEKEYIGVDNKGNVVSFSKK